MKELDDLSTARRIDRNADDDYNDPSEDPYFYVTDHQFSVRAVVRDTGEVVERVNYSPYGEATHSYENDFNRDGVIDVNDPSYYLEQQPELDPGVRLLVPTSGSTPDENYYAELDVNRDGQVFDSPGFGDFVPWHNETDGGTLSIPAPPTGWISDHEQHLATFQQGPDNPIGYTGHIFDPETRMYLARYRHYRPTLGRWMQPDPAGYTDGMSLYNALKSSPIVFVDPLGLSSERLCRLRKAIKKHCDGDAPGRDEASPLETGAGRANAAGANVVGMFEGVANMQADGYRRAAAHAKRMYDIAPSDGAVRAFQNAEAAAERASSRHSFWGRLGRVFRIGSGAAAAADFARMAKAIREGRIGDAVQHGSRGGLDALQTFGGPGVSNLAWAADEIASMVEELIDHGFGVQKAKHADDVSKASRCATLRAAERKLSK